MPYNRNSRPITVFHGFAPLDDNIIPVGYAALIQQYQLMVPLPDHLSAVGPHHQKQLLQRWNLYTPRHQPENSLVGHLTFALKHEGIELTTLKALFQTVGAAPIEKIVHAAPTGGYSRRIWFLYEWLCEIRLNLDDSTQGNYVTLVNSKLQYPGPLRRSKRQRIQNNLPGVPEFCPMVLCTPKLEQWIQQDLSETAARHIGQTHRDLISRAAAFLLLKDSRASFTIEGESPPHNRVERWGKAIGEAGQYRLTIKELERLQKIVIADYRFVMPGLRAEGGFVGDHERSSGLPLPVHISARADDLLSLLNGIIETSQLLEKSDYDAVLMATQIAFGFVFIHPFEDGNGRIHRYLIHHILAIKGFVPKGLTFPISSVILERIDAYSAALEHYSKPRLQQIQWRPTKHNNVSVLNDTADLYRYFDATRQAEFLFECVEETVNKTLPEEVEYLIHYDQLTTFIQNLVEMPDRMADLLIRFLRQNDGELSKRGRSREFDALTEDEIRAIEQRYQQLFW